MSRRNKQRYGKSHKNTSQQLAPTAPIPDSAYPGSAVAPAAGYQIVAQAQSTSFSGPLPHPDILKKYDEVSEGLAERIVAMAEKQTAHRHSLEGSVVRSDILKSYWGLAAAFVLGLTSIIGGSFVAYNGHEWAGGAIATSVVVALVTAFLKETNSRRGERTEKAQLMANPRGK